ncbi:DNA-binding protein [Vulcanibacillus modesticaldus]|uniref:RNA-binding protein KhpB n=2 Tax=Vulcanibacillus modesticaldus TaxID=337097 RepID=A0A1D2YV83_9BACI|nr:RNA-binding cell elongation regulator Jag/EloR [Vulcanibacillus modesticaldus]OEF99624.1 DNA-binding protein [Vulcanibacillus modesticaldus]
MEKVIATGKTVEEAVNSALEKLGTTKENVEVIVIQQPGKRLFGLMGKKDAVVQVEIIQREVNPINEAKKFLSDVFQSINLSVQIEQLNQKEHILFNLVGRDLGVLIGRRGQTLDSLQYLVNVVANKYTKDSKVRIILDAENYRSRRKQTLERLANRLAEKVVRTGRDVVLEPMTPLERKIIHTKLQNHPRVQTYSQGEEPYRKIVITKK